MAIAIKRAYDQPGPDDGLRVLVDRLWPRGLAKRDAAIDEWPKDATPSDGLRRWFHGGGDFDDFAGRYRTELDAGDAGAALAAVVAAHDRTTLVTAAREIEPSHASVLRDWITARTIGGGPP